tara:strand:- start:347 stop:535 length:189 start_codon:yes stop_codon:yes gene_type:complete
MWVVLTTTMEDFHPVVDQAHTRPFQVDGMVVEMDRVITALVWAGEAVVLPTLGLAVLHCLIE